MRLVDADALMDIYADRLGVIANRYSPDSSECGILSGAMKLLLAQPATIIEPIRGRWEYHSNPNFGINVEDAYCSKCGYHVDITMVDFDDYDFCPSCGCYMKG